MTDRITYKDAGVDVELADRTIRSVSDSVRSTFRPEVIGDLGGFAAMFKPKWRDLEDPILVSATDGVGTKLKLAFHTGIHNTVGIDLVAMNVNDIVVAGAEPLFFLDYLATGALEPDTITAVIDGITAGCRAAGCALIGGETAEMPDFYAAGEYDLAGFCVGMVDRARIIDGSAAAPGHVLIGLASSGLHSNGFSLVRKVLLERGGYPLDKPLGDLERTLGEELLTPTRIYVPTVLDLISRVPVSSLVHITGGGFHGNIPRMLPKGSRVVIRKGSWPVYPIFDILRAEAGLDDDEMFRTFNMGIGMIVAVAPEVADSALSLLSHNDTGAWIIGEIIAGGESESSVHIE